MNESDFKIIDIIESEQIEYLKSPKRPWRDTRNQLINILGGFKCVRCGFLDSRALVIDHIYGGGTQEQKAVGRRALNDYYLKHPEEAKEKLQILCANCNMIKAGENNERSQGFKSSHT